VHLIFLFFESLRIYYSIFLDSTTRAMFLRFWLHLKTYTYTATHKAVKLATHTYMQGLCLYVHTIRLLDVHQIL
jgi:hypothetical protein